MKQLLLVLAIVMLSLDPLRAQSSHQEQNGSSCPQAFGGETEDDQGIQPETTLLALNQAGQPERIGQRGGGRRGGRKGGKRGGGTPDGKRKPSISDTLRANIYADNILRCIGLQVEPKVCVRMRVGAVADKTFVGQDWQNIAGEIHLGAGR